MRRSPVLSGRWDARDRAQQRHRRDRQGPAPPSREAAVEALQEWLETSEFTSDALDEAYAIDLADYLQRTSHIGLASSERLRRLAVQLDGLWHDFTMIDRVYSLAVELAPDDAVAWESRGITAQHFAIVATSEDARRRFAQTALRYHLRAVDLAPRDAHVVYRMGRWHYEFGERDEAATWFERALAVEPQFAWALLFRAHCLQDAEQWEAAAAAYDAVPRGALQGKQDVLLDLTSEQQAWCHLRAGQRARAIEGFERLLSRFEKEPLRAHYAPLPHLPAAVGGELRAELLEHYQRVAAAAELPSV